MDLANVNRQGVRALQTDTLALSNCDCNMIHSLYWHVLDDWHQLFAIYFGITGSFTAVWLVTSSQIHAGVQR